MIIDCQHIEIHEGVRLNKRIEKSVDASEARILWFPKLSFVLVKHNVSKVTKVIAFTNIHVLTPKQGEDGELSGEMKDLIVDQTVVKPSPSHCTKRKKTSKSQ